MNREHKEIASSGWRSRLRQVSGATPVLVFTAILTRLITLLTQMVIAREFGLSMFSDAYFATENVPELFFEFVAVGFSMVFIPMFTKYRVAGQDDEAWRFASSFFLLSTSISLTFAVIAAVGAPLLVGLIAPGFHGLTRQTAITLIRIMSLSIVFLGIDAGIRGLLHSYKEFVVPELARIVYNSAVFAFALFLSSRFGVFVLAWGIVFGAVSQLALLFWGALNRGILRLVWAFDLVRIKRIVGQMLLFVIAIAGINILFMLDRMVASGLPEGSIAALNYAGRIILLPVGIFALPLRTTLYPGLSALAAQSQLPKLAESMLLGLKVLLFIVIPACLGLAVLRVPLTQLFFERGAFDHLATLATSEALIYYAVGVPAIAMIFVLNNAYLSLGDPLSLVKLNIFAWLTNLLLSLLLGQYLGHIGVALGTSISVTLTVILMIYILKQRWLRSLNVRSLIHSACRITAVSVVMGLLLMLLLDISNQILVQLPLYYHFLQMVTLILIGGSTYLIIGRLLKLDELMVLTTTFRRL